MAVSISKKETTITVYILSTFYSLSVVARIIFHIFFQYVRLESLRINMLFYFFDLCLISFTLNYLRLTLK